MFFKIEHTMNSFLQDDAKIIIVIRGSLLALAKKRKEASVSSNSSRSRGRGSVIDRRISYAKLKTYEKNSIARICRPGDTLFLPITDQVGDMIEAYIIYLNYSYVSYQVASSPLMIESLYSTGMIYL